MVGFDDCGDVVVFGLFNEEVVVGMFGNLFI